MAAQQRRLAIKVVRAELPLCPIGSKAALEQ